MMRVRISPTSSEASVRSGDPTVSRKETLFWPSSSGAPGVLAHELNGFQQWPGERCHAGFELAGVLAQTGDDGKIEGARWVAAYGRVLDFSGA